MFATDPWFYLMLSILATWRLVRLIACEDGPFDLIVKARRRAGSGIVGHLMDCPYCLGLWLAIPFAFTLTDFGVAWGLAWLAIAGGAAFVENLLECLAVRQPGVTGAALHSEHQLDQLDQPH